MWWSLCRLPARRISQSHLAICNARMVNVKSPPDGTEETEHWRPLKFSTSKGSHSRWTVAQSLGSDYQRPWWKVVPVCLFISAVLIWAAFREETEIDKILYRPVSELMEEIERKGENEKKK